MKSRYLRMIKKQRGFTLIELLAVILILGIIALIAIPTVNSVIKQARKGALESTGNQIVTSTEQYFMVCDLSGGYDKNGNKCPDDLRGSVYSSLELSDVIGVKGDFPDINDFVVYKKNPNGTTALVYRNEGFACSNQVDASGNISYKYTGLNNSDGVKCTEKKISSTGNVLLQTDGTKHVMKSYQETSGEYSYMNITSGMINEDFRVNSVRNTIYEIKFINHVNIPNSVLNDNKWDVSEAQDRSIMAWIEPIEEGSQLNTLFIGSKGDIYANPNSGFLFSEFINLVHIDFGNFNTDDVTSMIGMFFGDLELTTLDVSSFNTSNVSDMSWMFAFSGYLLELDLSNFNTSNVENMEGMFNNLVNAKRINISNFDTSNVKKMGFMFETSESLTELDVSSFNTSNVIDMNTMFYGLISLTELDVSNFDTRNVVDMSYMFSGSPELIKIDVSNFDTSNVKNMKSMFSYLDNIESIDISSFDTSNVEHVEEMFLYDYSLSKIYVGTGWNTSKMSGSTNMFGECTNLAGATRYDSNKTGLSMANYTTGYLTLKS